MRGGSGFWGWSSGVMMPSLRASASAARATSAGTSSGQTIALLPSSATIAKMAAYGSTHKKGVRAKESVQVTWSSLTSRLGMGTARFSPSCRINWGFALRCRGTLTSSRRASR